MRIAVLAGALLLAAAGGARAQEEPGIEISGRVVDAAGKPVKGAEVSPFWICEGGKALPTDAAATGADGTFRITVQTWGRAWSLTAMDAERRRAAFLRGGKEAPKEPVTILLGPSVRVRGTFTCGALGGKPEWTMVYVYTPDREERIAQCDSEEAVFSLVLPAGDWSLHMYGTDVQGIDRPLAAKAGPDIDLGAVEFQPTFLATHYGSRLPAWTVTDARGTKKDAQIADFRGRWVLVEFWGFW